MTLPPGAMTLPPGDWWQGAAAQAVLAALDGQARFVGGAVRDALQGLPVQDVDLATPLLPETVLARAQAAGLKAVPTGIDHGTITLVSAGRPFEITTLRRDVETDGRHATVAFTDRWEEDAARRDFTINALYADADGQVYDPVGGLPDLAAGRLRFIGDARQRIAEDYLRLLRYFRFYARYARLPPDAALLALLTETAPGLDRLSPERVWSELKRLLAGPTPTDSLRLMQQVGILERLLPAIRPDGPALLAALPERADWAARLLVLLQEGADLPGLAVRLRWSKAELDFISVCQQTAEANLEMPYSLARRFGTDPIFSGLSVRQARGIADREAWRDWLAAPLPPFPLGGADVQALGVAPGPAMGRLLRTAEAWWDAGHCRADRAETLAYLKSLLPAP